MKRPRHSEHGCLVRYKECIDNRSVTTILSHWHFFTLNPHIHFGHGRKMWYYVKSVFVASDQMAHWVPTLFPTVANLDKLTSRA